MTLCKFLKMMVPRAGVEPAHPYGQRILRPLAPILSELNKRDEPILTGLAAIIRGVESTISVEVDGVEVDGVECRR